MKNILQSHINKLQFKNIFIKEELENIVLVSGILDHKSNKQISTRDGITIKDEKILLNFDEPKNRFFSKNMEN
jgi:hypothetical protein